MTWPALPGDWEAYVTVFGSVLIGHSTALLTYLPSMFSRPTAADPIDR
ncbi:MAG TPA: hypothetical protein VM737_05460 [Gemmatimonadota bacterium]|nr:hypothetical protein [Gemmatimonadota bacterium]